MPDYTLRVNGALRTVRSYLLNQPNERPVGVGEGSQGPTGAAIANALANATGRRLRALPFTADKVKAALV